MATYDEIYSNYVGIEDALDETESSESKKFNPRQLSLTSKRISMDAIMRRLEQGTLILNPDFQRDEVWNEKAKSLLIESLMLRIPVPMFYFACDRENNFTVVDGLQRLSAIRDFVVGKEYLQSIKDGCTDPSKKGCGMKLGNLEYLEDYDGYIMNDLPQAYINRIMETEFSVTIIEPDTPEDVKRNIFRRINTGGLPLSRQEIRNALYTGAATRLLKDLRNSTEFKAATNNSIKPRRSEDLELILRCISFIIRNPSDYKYNDMDAWLSQTMQIINNFDKTPSTEDNKMEELSSKFDLKPVSIHPYYTVQELSLVFKLSMNRAKLLFGKQAFRKIHRTEKDKIKAGKIAKPLFEMWGSLLAFLPEDDFKILLQKKEVLIEKLLNLLKDQTFIMNISKSSTHPSVMEPRFNAIKKIIYSTIQY